METKICSKCGIEKLITEYHKNGFNSQGIQKYRTYCKECANAIERQRYKDKRSFTDAQKTQCAKCGDTRTYVLDFHHKDRKEKEFTIGQFKKGSLELIQAEINKCICLCANCHREFHYLEKLGYTLDTYLSNNGESSKG